MSEVILDEPCPGVALLRRNRPEVLNALGLSQLGRRCFQLLFASADRDQEGIAAMLAKREPRFTGT